MEGNREGGKEGVIVGMEIIIFTINIMRIR